MTPQKPFLFWPPKPNRTRRYTLPEAQLDRFMFLIRLNYPIGKMNFPLPEERPGRATSTL